MKKLHEAAKKLREGHRQDAAQLFAEVLPEIDDEALQRTAHYPQFTPEKLRQLALADVQNAEIEEAIVDGDCNVVLIALILDLPDFDYLKKAWLPCGVCNWAQSLLNLEQAETVQDYVWLAKSFRDLSAEGFPVADKELDRVGQWLEVRSLSMEFLIHCIEIMPQDSFTDFLEGEHGFLNLIAAQKQ